MAGQWALQQMPQGLRLDLTEGKSVVLGRLPELNIRSLQVSRKHASVSLGPSSTPSITATGRNPLLVEKGRKRTLLKAGESTKLKNGHLIYLDPGCPDVCFSIVFSPDTKDDTTVDARAEAASTALARCADSADVLLTRKNASDTSIIDLSSPACAVGHNQSPIQKTPKKQLLSPGRPNCVICTDSIDAIQGKLSCQHSFCFDCIQQWARIATVCPLCKAEFSSISKSMGSGQQCCVKVTPKKQRIHNDDDGHWGDAEEEVLPCMLCDNADNEHLLLLCDGCDAPCHTYCAGLPAVPSGDWYCMVCKVEREQRGRTPDSRAAARRLSLSPGSSSGSQTSGSHLCFDGFAMGSTAAAAGQTGWTSARSSFAGATGPEAAWRSRQMQRAEDMASQLYVDDEGNPFIVGDDDVEYDSSQDSTLEKYDPDCATSHSDASSVGSDAPPPSRQRGGAKKRRLKKKRPRSSSSRAASSASTYLPHAAAHGPMFGGPSLSKVSPPRQSPVVLSGESHRFGLRASGASSAATDPAEIPSILPESASLLPSTAPVYKSAVASSVQSSSAHASAPKKARRGVLGISKRRPNPEQSKYFS